MKLSSILKSSLLASALLGAAASTALADSTSAPPVLSAGPAVSLQYTEGYFAPSVNYSNSQIYIADGSWQLCALRGNQAVGSSEGGYTFKSGNAWYIRYWKNTWMVGFYWYCIK